VGVHRPRPRLTYGVCTEANPTTGTAEAYGRRTLSSRRASSTRSAPRAQESRRRPHRRSGSRERHPTGSGKAGAAPAGRRDGRRKPHSATEGREPQETPAKPSRRATGPGFARPDPSSAQATARRDQLGHRARLDLSEPCFQQPRV
jgi:hypothetical protein